MTDHFRHLIEGFCRHAGLDESGRIMGGGAVIVDDVVFSLVHDETRDPHIVFIYCDFGDMPPGRQADMCLELLEANMFLYSGSGPAFTVSRETGHVVLADRFPLNRKSSPEELRATLAGLAAMAVQWRSGQFSGHRPAHNAQPFSARSSGMR